jgi:D-alanyl-lipoteichoic acid acyltransferase DltB (MBOAT superfamily)
MGFNSLTFLVFFAAVWLLHQAPLPWTVKKFNLLVASYLFYAAWNPPFVLLLLLAAVLDFFLARWLDRSERPALRRAILVTSLGINLGLLAYFKYGNFLLANFQTLLEGLGVRYGAAAPDIILPLGISFYTFETISYLIDVYRRRMKPWGSFLDYALFLTFFPHLVAGPIIRAPDFLPQCRAPHKATGAQVGWGLTLFVIGLFEKVVLADAVLAPVADKVFDNPGRAGFADAALGVLAFSGQIFFDFAGYSLCAIGAALSLGFVFKDNFHFPYAAVGFADFWRRWHISLSTWLRDYLYIALGGSRHGAGKTYRNLMITMLLGGLWHGAAWRFIAWGGLHGLYLAGERAVRRAYLGPYGPRLAGAGPVRLLLMLGTFAVVSLTWVFFRAHSFEAAFQILGAVAAPPGWQQVTSGKEAIYVLIVVGGLVAGQWVLRDSSLEAAAARMPGWLRAAALALLLIGLALAPGDNRAFIYFQF